MSKPVVVTRPWLHTDQVVELFRLHSQTCHQGQPKGSPMPRSHILTKQNAHTQWRQGPLGWSYLVMDQQSAVTARWISHLEKGKRKSYAGSKTLPASINKKGGTLASFTKKNFKLNYNGFKPSARWVDCWAPPARQDYKIRVNRRQPDKKYHTFYDR